MFSMSKYIYIARSLITINVWGFLLFFNEVEADSCQSISQKAIHAHRYFSPCWLRLASFGADWWSVSTSSANWLSDWLDSGSIAHLVEQVTRVLKARVLTAGTWPRPFPASIVPSHSVPNLQHTVCFVLSNKGPIFWSLLHLSLLKSLSFSE